MDIKDKLKLIRENSNSYIPTNENLSDNMILQEAYFGKNEVLLECEKLFDEAIYKNNLDKAKLLIKKIEIKLANLFNFKTLVLSTIPNGVASTLPITTYKFKYIVNDIKMEHYENGIRFRDSEEVEALIFIDIGACRRAKLTGDEAVAIILHEIGHSMSTILPSAWIANSLMGAIALMTVVPAVVYNFLSGPALDAARFIDDIIPEALKRFISSLEDIFIRIAKISDYFIMILNPKKYLKMLIAKILTIKPSPFGLLHFKNEELSDYVSSIYGYGPQLVSALTKFTISTDTWEDNIISRLFNLPLHIISLALNPHPTNVSRFKLILQNLEMELSKELNKDAYNMIKNDIEMVKAEIEKYDKFISKDGKNIDLVLIKKISIKLLEGHTDIRALFLNLKPKDVAKIDELKLFPVIIKTDPSITEASELYSELSKYPKEKRDCIIKMLIE